RGAGTAGAHSTRNKHRPIIPNAVKNLSSIPERAPPFVGGGASRASEKYSRRNVESLAQFLYVSFVEFTFLVQHFGHDAFRAKDRDQILLPKIIGIHQRP